MGDLVSAPSRTDRIVLFIFGVLQAFSAYGLLPSYRLFASNDSTAGTLIISAMLFGICALSCVIASLFPSTAKYQGLSILGLLIAEGIFFGPRLILGFFLGAAMSADSGASLSVRNIFIFAVPLVLIAIIIMALIAVYRIGLKNLNASTLGPAFAIALIVASIAYGGKSLVNNSYAQQTNTIASIDTSSLTIQASDPVITGTVTGKADICIEIVKSTYAIGEKMMLFGGDPNLIGAACTTSGDLIIENGHWHTKFLLAGFTVPLTSGTYTAVINNWSTWEVLNKETILVR